MVILLSFLDGLRPTTAADPVSTQSHHTSYMTINQSVPPRWPHLIPIQARDRFDLKKTDLRQSRLSREFTHSYDTFPISFVTNNFSPREIRDERISIFSWNQDPQADENLLLDRANQLRGDVNRGTVTAPLIVLRFGQHRHGAGSSRTTVGSGHSPVISSIKSSHTSRSSRSSRSGRTSIK